MNTLKYILMLFLAALLFSCSEEGLDSDSIFGQEAGMVENEFDVWIYNNYTKPYNIDFKYRLEDKETDESYNLAPADYNKAIALAKMTKHVWIESYEETVGTEFIRTYCPKIMFLVGSVAYNSQGSVVLGTAEGGLKITLYNVNSIDVDNLDIETLNYWFFKTMHHEFAHILHQTKNYSTDFNEISPSNYQAAGWVNIDEKDALNLGFVSKYASSEPREDFVEIIAIYVTNTQEYWNNLVGSAEKEGQDMINQKLELVKDYLRTSWGFNLDELRDIVLRRSEEILTMDLTTLN